MIIGVPKETTPGEQRVALVPDAVKTLVSRDLTVVVEKGAGAPAGFRDEAYAAAGAEILSGHAKLLGAADLVVKVGPPRPTTKQKHEIDALKEGAALVGLLRPLDQPELAARFAKRRIDAFALELLPRITRAQSMDVLSSQSTISGYRAVLLAAVALPRIFPMLVSAAGTLQPARVLVIGAGVAGLQALGTAKRLGAVTLGYDTRPVVREQVESLGARFVELDLDTGDAEDAGGYAKARSADFYREQRAQLGKQVVGVDVVITTALVPGQAAPLLIEEEVVAKMRPGSVIVDLAAEKGGNCACTKPDREIEVHGVTIIGHTNLPAQVPTHASQMLARNFVTFLEFLVADGQLRIDLEDEITRGTLLTHDGEIVHEQIRNRLAAGREGGGTGAAPGARRGKQW
ncbi:MAG: Re/Si-specific NAD(P)(+) transhydrogenase subunit alpha [Myxococcota bacterium]